MMITRNSLLFLASSNLLSRSILVAAVAAVATTRNTVAFVALTRPHDLVGIEGWCRYHSGIHSRRTRCTASENTSNGSYDDKLEGKESVTGILYTDDSDSNDQSLTVTLFTKNGCTLCDKVVDILRSVRGQQPHRLMAVDITDPDKSYWYQKYKYDIPILHLNGRYWVKHRLTKEQALSDLEAARIGSFVEKLEDEPDAGAMERRQAERKSRRDQK